MSKADRLSGPRDKPTNREAVKRYEAYFHPKPAKETDTDSAMASYHRHADRLRKKGYRE